MFGYIDLSGILRGDLNTETGILLGGAALLLYSQWPRVSGFLKGVRSSVQSRPQVIEIDTSHEPVDSSWMDRMSAYRIVRATLVQQSKAGMPDAIKAIHTLDNEVLPCLIKEASELPELPRQIPTQFPEPRTVDEETKK